jgi:hypothetical protein
LLLFYFFSVDPLNHCLARACAFQGSASEHLVLVTGGRLRLRHLPAAPAAQPSGSTAAAAASLGPVVGELAAGEYYGERSLVAQRQTHKVTGLGGGGGGSSSQSDCEVLLLSRHDFQRLASTVLADDWAWACPVGERWLPAPQQAKVVSTRDRTATPKK